MKRSVPRTLILDFEFQARPGERPLPICAVALDFTSGRLWRVWLDPPPRVPPWPTGRSVTVVAFSAIAEITCLLSLAWVLPSRLIDLMPEFCVSGRRSVKQPSLADALRSIGLDFIDAAEKAAMYALAERGGPFLPHERDLLLRGCEKDVAATAHLYTKLLPKLDIPRALLRGRTVCSMAKVEFHGVPVDVEKLERIRAAWPRLRHDVIAEMDANYGVYVDGRFSHERFRRYVRKSGVRWPTTPTGRLSTDKEVFKEIARLHPEFEDLRELRATLSKLDREGIPVGADGMSRTSLRMFASLTSRNQPRTSEFIFGQSAWLRGVIRAPPGYAVLYADYSQQEIGVAAALSGDPVMRSAYESGDAYLAAAIQARIAPLGASEESHTRERDLFKVVCLGVLYGMGAKGLARRLGISIGEAKALYDAHRRTYPRFWTWSDAVVDYAHLHGVLFTTLGWRYYPTPVAADGTRPNLEGTLRNFLMQATGAEILRVACMYADDDGLRVCAPVHDALLVLVPIDKLDEYTARTRSVMERASVDVLGGFKLRIKVKSAPYPQHYADKAGEKMTAIVDRLLRKMGQSWS